MVTASIGSRLAAQPAPFAQRPHRSGAATWFIIGIPILIGAVLAWQVASKLLHADSLVRSAVAVSRVSLEADPLGTRIDLVLVDRVGQDTTLNGGVTIKLREPDGTVWERTRTVTPADFGSLKTGGLLAGRVGYSVVVPATDWLRAPRQGGAATVRVGVAPADGAAFSTVADERFP